MPQWGNSDAASNSVIWAPAGLNKAPTRAEANTLYGNTSAGGYITGRTDGMFAVDEDEVRAGAGGHAGWALKTTGSGGRAGRVQYETLVVQSRGFASDNDADVVPNFVIIIDSNPSDAEIADGANASFSVSAHTNPLGKTITFQWEEDQGSGFVNVTDGGVYGGATSNTLVLTAANTDFDTYEYRVVVSGANAASVTSSAAVLTVTA